MRNLQLKRLIDERENNIMVMIDWTMEKTGRHIDIINQQLRWAFQPKNDDGMEILNQIQKSRKYQKTPFFHPFRFE